MLHYHYPACLGKRPSFYRCFVELLDCNVPVAECDRFISSFYKKIRKPFLEKLFLEKGKILHEVLDREEKKRFTEMLRCHALEYMKERVFYAPLQSVSGAVWRGENFSLITTDELRSEVTTVSILDVPALEGASRWLKVFARNQQIAREKEEVVLGAFCLAISPSSRFQFSMASPLRGWILGNGGYISEGAFDLHLPSVEEFIFTAYDFEWFKIIDQMLSNEGDSKFRNSLRSIYRTWFVDGTQRFEMFIVAIEALMPSSCNSYHKKCLWISKNCGEQVDLLALKLLFKKIRSDVAHGDVASIEHSKHYAKFIELYEEDPLVAIENVVSHVVQRIVLETRLRVQNHPIAKYEDVPKLTENYLRKTGLDSLPTGEVSLTFLNRGFREP